MRKEREAQEQEAKRIEEEHRRNLEAQRLQMEREERERIEQINNVKASFSEKFSTIKKVVFKNVEFAENIEHLATRASEIEEKIASIDNINRAAGVEELFEEFKKEADDIVDSETRIKQENFEKKLTEIKNNLKVKADELNSLLVELREKNEKIETVDAIDNKIQKLRDSINPINNLTDVTALQENFNELYSKVESLLNARIQEEESLRKLEELERKISSLRDTKAQLELLSDKKILLDDVIGGNKKAKAKTAALINSFKRYSEGGREPLSKGILYYGDPGTGKTSLAKAVAAEAGMELFFINPSLAMSDNGERKVLDVIELARKSARISGSPVILLIDEIDAIAQKRSSSNSDKVLVLLMNEIDKLKAEDKVIIIATTNRREALDPAIIRSGRIDQSVEIGLPNTEDKKKILQIYLQLIKTDKSINLNAIVDKMKNFSGADIKRTVDSAIDMAMDRQKASRVSEVTLTSGDLQNAIVTIIDEKIESYR